MRVGSDVLTVGSIVLTRFGGSSNTFNHLVVISSRFVDVSLLC